MLCISFKSLMKTLTPALWLLCVHLCRRRWTPAPWCRLFSAAWPTTPTCPKEARSTRRPRTTRPSHRARNPSRYLSTSMYRRDRVHATVHTCTQICYILAAINQMLWQKKKKAKGSCRRSVLSPASRSNDRALSGACVLSGWTRWINVCCSMDEDMLPFNHTFSV